MTYTLAERLGKTVAEVRRDVSSSEFCEWMGFYEWRAQVERAQAERAGAGSTPRGMGRGG